MIRTWKMAKHMEGWKEHAQRRKVNSSTERKTFYFIMKTTRKTTRWCCACASREESREESLRLKLQLEMNMYEFMYLQEYKFAVRM